MRWYLLPLAVPVVILMLAALMGLLAGFTPPGVSSWQISSVIAVPEALAGDVRGRIVWSTTMVLLLTVTVPVAWITANELRPSRQRGPRARFLARSAWLSAFALVVLMGTLAAVGVSYAGAPGAALLAPLELQLPLSVAAVQDLVIIGASAMVLLSSFAFAAVCAEATDASAGAAPSLRRAVERCDRLLAATAAFLAATVAEFTALFRWSAERLAQVPEAHAPASAFAAGHAAANALLSALLLALLLVSARFAISRTLDEQAGDPQSCPQRDPPGACSAAVRRTLLVSTPLFAAAGITALLT